MNVRAAVACVVSAALGATLVAAVTAAGDSNPGHYTVDAADTWQSIATAHGVTGDALQLANDLAASTSNTGHPRTGWIIHIPEVPPSTTTTTVLSTTTSTAATTTTSSTSPTSTTVAPSTTTATTVPPATTTTAAPSSTTAPPPPTSSPTSSSTSTTTSVPAPTTTAPPAGVAFSEDFSDPTAFSARFDHGWSGELHAGSLFGADKDGWPMDHDLSCGNPNTTSHIIHLGAGTFGENSPPAASEPAFMACAPSGVTAAAHLMTAANTEGYIIGWFSPKPTFTNIRKVCVDVSQNYLGNGQWWQMVFLSPTEAAQKPNIDGVTYNVLDLGYTSPEFPAGGPTTPQHSAQNGIKFGLFSDNGQISTTRLSVRPWDNGSFRGGFELTRTGGMAITDKAPRFPFCVTDQENGTLRFDIASVDGTTRTAFTAGVIPNGTTRVVFEHDEYNPDKHYSNSGEIATNSGAYTIHWDNVQVFTG